MRTWKLWTVWVASLALGMPAAGLSPDLSPGAVKRKLRAAEKVLKAGRLEAAVVQYEEILSATRRGESFRAKPLYTVALWCLDPQPERRDLVRARQLLDELATSFPDHERRLEIMAARAWLEELGALRSAKTQAEDELVAKSQEQEDRQLVLESLAAEMDELKNQLARVSQELAATKEELAKKDETLQKVLQDRVIRRSPGKP